MANKAYRYRIYPDKDQRQKLAATFGCARFVYNKCLDEHERRYAAGEKYASKTDMNNYCVRTLKKEFPFLKEVDKFALTNAVFNLDKGYQRMFRKQGRHPKYKSRHRSGASYTTNYTNGNIKVLNKKIQLPKIGKVKAVIHRRAPGGYVLKSAAVTMEKDGSYYVSVLYEYHTMTPLTAGKEAVGLDYRSDGLFVTSEGTVCGMPHYYRKSERKLAKAQRGLRKKKKGSGNWKKQIRTIARIHRHIADQRKDFLHKISAGTANRYDIVCVEELNMRAMANKGFGNGKATLDNGYGMFLNYLEYKLRDRGKYLIKVGRWYPSSQLCSRCKEQQAMPISVRKYRCPRCGNIMDRDLNAAINIKNEGMRIYRRMTA